jgi:hypothetical protein
MGTSSEISRWNTEPVDSKWRRGGIPAPPGLTRSATYRLQVPLLALNPRVPRIACPVLPDEGWHPKAPSAWWDPTAKLGKTEGKNFSGRQDAGARHRSGETIGGSRRVEA